MELLILLIILLIPGVSNCQVAPDNFKSIVVDKKEKFDIANENKVIKGVAGFTSDTVRADLAVNNDDIRRIWHVKSTRQEDTLSIEIHRTDEAYDHHFLIKILNGKYKIDYRYQMDGPQSTRKITLIKSILRLNSLDFKKGKEIRGHAEFEGTCYGEGCYGETTIAIKGNFKFRIK